MKRICGGEAVVFTDKPLASGQSPKRWGGWSGASNMAKPLANNDGAHAVTRPTLVLVATLILLLATLLPASATQVRDLVMVSGARDNQLVGYGLVAGLAGDGDKDPVYTKQTVANLLQRYGINVPATTLSAKNVAVVMVTADIPAFAKSGTRLDIQVASMGDAKSLQGGVLLQTPLLGADNKVYAVAQGPLSIGGFVAGGGGASVTKNHPTAAQIVNGA
ncbi:MAG TPA: flagellar basal body P-ring protein FlgI, partial [Verrucomicrobiae bacterium]|nr:flagellar basal body P-ring protein FlgI [Verrucomicrobiae bacterium]